MTKSIRKVLVANRGEIALRVLRTCKEQGISTVAVFSEADRGAPFVRFADEAYLLGPAPSAESYLKIDKILEICRAADVDAVHPGYGFLSENALFSEMVEKSGIKFIGPSADAIRTMGDKISSKIAVKSYGVPLVPGMDKPVENVEEAKKIAEDIGYPVLIKATAGGGGKGMRIVHESDQLGNEIERAASEASSSFGNADVFIEKYITSPKHIEVQILGDSHGNILYLMERDCSIQRRHQKVIEEAPSAILNDVQRRKIGEAAVQVAKACNYVNAGTVEFVMDEDKNFYFLEMNTRLQVEHPVTEEITGFDLVKEQIHIAEGKAIPFTQEDIKIHGHSMEVRVYAEDPMNNFAPSIGKLKKYIPPRGPGVRVDDGYEEGMEIPIYYDSMISKLITKGENREEAIKKMIRAIEEYNILGIETTLPFCKFVLEHENFVGGHFTTKFVESYFDPDLLKEELTQEEQIATALVAKELWAEKEAEQKPKFAANQSAWRNRLRD